jgi:hypothetical protein
MRGVTGQVARRTQAPEETMKRLELVVAALVALVATPAAAHGRGYPQPGPPPGPPPGWAPPADRGWRPAPARVELALRAGLTVPAGDAQAGVPMRDLFGEQVSVGVDLGLRLDRRLYLGTFAEGGVGLAGDLYRTACGRLGDQHCGAASGRLGMAIHYHLDPDAPIDPWIGYGVALSGATVGGDAPGGSFSVSYAGFEYAKLMAGLDLQTRGGAALGIVAEWSHGTFETVSVDDPNGVLQGTTAGARSSHSWFTIGPRLRF